MDITIYTTEGCYYCDQLKELFRRANITNYTTLGKDDLIKDYPDVAGFPQVIIDGVHVGGLVDTAKYLVEKGLVTSRKK